MRPASRDNLERTAFLLSLVVLALLYGFAAREYEWFPNSLLERARHQADAVNPFRAPYFLTNRVYDWSGVRTPRPDRVQPGLTLVSSLWSDFDWMPGLKLMNREGRVLHGWEVDPRELFPESPLLDRNLKHRHVHASFLFPNGDVLATVDNVGTARLDACGRERWRVPNTHNSIARAADGSFWIPARREIPGEGPSPNDRFEGLNSSIYHELLLRVSEEGEVLDRISMLDVLYANGLDRYLVKMHQRSRIDPVRVRGVQPLPASVADEYPLFEARDLVVSIGNLDLVLVVDPGSERVRWHEWDLFLDPRNPDFLGNGWIGTFDNRTDGTDRGTVLGGSRVVAVQPHTDSTKVLFPTPRSDPFFTSQGGKWQPLDNGNLLLVETLASRLVEVTPAGRTAWEWAQEPYDESRVAPVWDATRYGLTAEEVASWPCSPAGSTEHPRPSSP